MMLPSAQRGRLAPPSQLDAVFGGRETKMSMRLLALATLMTCACATTDGFVARPVARGAFGGLMRLTDVPAEELIVFRLQDEKAERYIKVIYRWLDPADAPPPALLDSSTSLRLTLRRARECDGTSNDAPIRYLDGARAIPSHQRLPCYILAPRAWTKHPG
jgi:hypothetical protein